MLKSVPNNQIRAFVLAMVGAISVAITMMFVPTDILESITGSTGLSELVPAARAPLGDTARALIAFSSGAFILVVLASLLTRQESRSATQAVQSVPASEWAAEDQPLSFMGRFGQIKLPLFALPKMPWHKNVDDITELGDLPKLRIGDSHPDAPPRRPLVASKDLPAFELSESSKALHEGQSTTPTATEVYEPLALADLKEEPASDEKQIIFADVGPTLSDMVAQLEAAVAERQRQLSELEAVATDLAHAHPISRTMGAPDQAQSEVEIIDQSGIFVEFGRTQRPMLEAVPSPAVEDDDMDSALAAALATLHRMNATGR